MKRTTTQYFMAGVLGLLIGNAVAGNCEIVVSRDACPGKDALSYKKCDGKKVCSEFVEAKDAAACKKAAVDACEVFRPGITKSKAISSVKFDGAAIKPDGSDADFCKNYPKREKEYNKC